jgi:hypothetical protein
MIGSEAMPPPPCQYEPEEASVSAADSIRRRSPWWVREMKSQALHRLGGRLYNDSQMQELTPNQEWLWSCVVSELEYRQRRQPPPDRCACLLCCAPFPDDVLP